MIVFLCVIFNVNNDGSLPNHLTYKIRQNASYTTTTQAVRNLFWYPGPRNWDYAYYTLGFMWVQVCFQFEYNLFLTIFYIENVLRI